jgi:hypothetical protein
MVPEKGPTYGSHRHARILAHAEQRERRHGPGPGHEVDIENLFTMQERPVLVDGPDPSSGFNQNVVYVGEVTGDAARPAVAFGRP